MSTDVMKQALEDAHTRMEHYQDEKARERAITALRQAIEQAERPTTHSEDCYKWHHACAVSRIEKTKNIQPVAQYGTNFITDLSHAIEQAEQAKPVAWQNTAKPTEIVAAQDWENIDPMWHWMYRPIYTAPPQRQPWVGLTGDEVNEFAAGCHLGNSVQGAIRKAEAKIKEKNT